MLAGCSTAVARDFSGSGFWWWESLSGSSADLAVFVWKIIHFFFVHLREILSVAVRDQLEKPRPEIACLLGLESSSVIHVTARPYGHWNHVSCELTAVVP